jgi:hypothetical protein
VSYGGPLDRPANEVWKEPPLRKIAFDERVKIHDLVMEGVDVVLRRRGYPSVNDLKAGRKR